MVFWEDLERESETSMRILAHLTPSPSFPLSRRAKREGGEDVNETADDEGDFVFRTAPPFSSRVLSAQAGIVDFDPVFPADRGFHEGVLDPPGGAVTDSQRALERQGREIVLGLDDQANGRKPGGQRELGAVKEGSGHQQGRMVQTPHMKVFRERTWST